MDEQQQQEEVKLKKVPVTILSGQLGSGKSTLLRRILTQQTQFKIAIIMNEFAQTASIEGKSIQLTVAKEGTHVQEWLELDNGCLCCSAQDQGVLAIESLMQRRGTFDYIIIETTGIADPSQIALLFWLDSALESSLYLDGIVTVVDCLNLEKQLEEEEATNCGTVTKQIAVADSIYLSKIDLISESKLISLKQTIRRMNDSNIINQSDEELGLVLKKILNLDAFSIYRKVPKTLINSKENEVTEINSELKNRLTTGTNENNSNSTTTKIKTNHNNSFFSTITINLPTLNQVNSTESKFDKTFRKLIWEGIIGDEKLNEKNKNEVSKEVIEEEPIILRAKGLLKDTEGNWYILQAVRDTYEIQLLDSLVQMDPFEQPRLVLIGKSLHPDLGDQFLKQIS